MKYMICLCLVAVAAVAFARPNEKYTSKYDNVDLDEILNNQRLLTPYMNCILEVPDAKCAPDAKELKGNIHGALGDGCAKCTEKHLAGVKKVIKFLINNRPEDWEKLCAKYDPEGKYSKKYENELKNAKA